MNQSFNKKLPRLKIKVPDIQQIERTHRAYKLAAVESGMTITPDERISEQDAAKLLGYAPLYLKQKREQGTAPPHYNRPAGKGRISYRLIDLATWIEEERNEQ